MRKNEENHSNLIFSHCISLQKNVTEAKRSITVNNTPVIQYSSLGSHFKTFKTTTSLKESASLLTSTSASLEKTVWWPHSKTQSLKKEVLMFLRLVNMYTCVFLCNFYIENHRISYLSITGYGGPLREVPHEKFNVTVIPKSYRSPWEKKLMDSEALLASISTRLPEPPHKLTPANYKCFNR